jgi:hypothetical protein
MSTNTKEVYFIAPHLRPPPGQSPDEPDNVWLSMSISAFVLILFSFLSSSLSFFVQNVYQVVGKHAGVL